MKKYFLMLFLVFGSLISFSKSTTNTQMKVDTTQQFESSVTKNDSNLVNHSNPQIIEKERATSIVPKKRAKRTFPNTVGWTSLITALITVAKIVAQNCK
jgi:ABC-type sugar transport system permease subunit